MNKSELMKTANEIRKGAITGVSSFPKDMLHLVITQLLQTVDIFRWKI